MRGFIAKVSGVLLVLLWHIAAQAGTVTYVYTDPQGTPLAEADASGNITATFDYRPYGAQVLGTPKSGLGYTGHVDDADSGLVYMQARYYDPQAVRFVSVDPLGPLSGFNQFNRYVYAVDNPIKNIDPDGRQVAPIDDNPIAMQQRLDAINTLGADKVADIEVASTADGLMSMFCTCDINYVAPSGSGALQPVVTPLAGLAVEGRNLLSATKLMASESGIASGLARQVGKEFGVAGAATRNGAGTVFKLGEGKVTVRVMASGGGRTNYLRISVEGKGSVDASGKLSSDPAKTHIPIDSDSIKLIREVYKRWAS